MTDIQKQLAEAERLAEWLDKHPRLGSSDGIHWLQVPSSDDDLYSKAAAELRRLAHRQQEARGPLTDDTWKLQFLTDVVTAAGLLSHGMRDRALAERISADAYKWRSEFFTAHGIKGE